MLRIPRTVWSLSRSNERCLVPAGVTRPQLVWSVSRIPGRDSFQTSVYESRVHHFRVSRAYPQRIDPACGRIKAAASWPTESFLLGTALFCALALAAFPGGPYTIWSSSASAIHLDNRAGLGNLITGQAYVNGSHNQYWSPILASPGTADVYYIQSNVSGLIYGNGTAGAVLTTQPFANAWLFTLLPGTTNTYTITDPLTDPVYALTVDSGSAFPLQLKLLPLNAGNLRQHWSFTDHGVLAT